jgi:DNA-binding LytR/AlgR family response regulator
MECLSLFIMWTEYICTWVNSTIMIQPNYRKYSILSPLTKIEFQIKIYILTNNIKMQIKKIYFNYSNLTPSGSSLKISTNHRVLEHLCEKLVTPTKFCTIHKSYLWIVHSPEKWAKIVGVSRRNNGSMLHNHKRGTTSPFSTQNFKTLD